MTKRRAAGRTTPLADTVPERAEVERAIEAVLERLRPKAVSGSKNSQAAADLPQPKPSGAASNRRTGPGRTGARTVAPDRPTRGAAPSKRPEKVPPQGEDITRTRRPGSAFPVRKPRS